MSTAEQTMIANLEKNTGKSLDEWITIVKGKEFAKHGEIVQFLKEEHGFTHGFANMVAHKSREVESEGGKETLVEDQYRGKEHFLPLYEQLLSAVTRFGSDIEVAPKKSYVSLRRKKQFATLGPATKSRFEIGINLRGEEGSGRLEKITSANAMCSHRINMESGEEVSSEILGWIRKAYDNAG